MQLFTSLSKLRPSDSPDETLPQCGNYKPCAVNFQSTAEKEPLRSVDRLITTPSFS
ncbi:hypothetical protein DESC_660078 [Desulfosarcina cetonica]|nr:hypothetical protein DESC_660078 [Desulfosarcina cetonica]